MDLRSTLADIDPSVLHALLLAQLAPGTVELVGASHEGLLVHLSGERTELLPSAAQQDRLSRWFMEDAYAGDLMHDPCVSFARNVFGNLLRESHGALIAIVRSGEAIPALGDDGTILSDPVELASRVVRHATDETTENYTDLMAAASLLGGMLNSDGITVVDTAGRVLGYNCFIRTAADDLKPSELVGGARRRAFNGLCTLVDSGQLRGAFIRSSDGASDFHGRDQ